MSKTRTRPSTKLLNIIALGALCAAAGASAHAAGMFAADPCDAQYMDSLEARAFVEAQREITQNQNLIFKPDSVLQYTCYDKFAGHMVDQANSGNLMSQSTRWGAAAGNMQNAANSLAGGPFDQYIKDNFDHDLLGGRMKGSKYDPAATVTAGGYACKVMYDVWMYAKCMDFIDDPAEDGFFTFAEYEADPDKRFLPKRCAKVTGLYKDPLEEAVKDSVTVWEEDVVVSRLDLIFPKDGQCNDPAKDPSVGFSKIKTGLKVENSKASSSSYDEYVCVVPGCYYDPGSSTCKR